MKCKKCKRVIADNSIFCNWCGFRQIAESRETKVPVPKHKGNTWYAQITVGNDRVYVSGKTESEYYARARAAKERVIEIQKSRPKLSLGTAIDKFIKDNTMTLSPSTIKAYKSYRKNRFGNYMDMGIGNIPYQKMINEEASDISPKTLANVWRLVTASLNYVGSTAPKVSLPKIPKSTRPWLDYEQIERFTKAIKGKDCELAALLALNGLRRSELLHLTSDDIDIERGLIFVRGASVYNDKGQFVSKKTNKNATSTRTVHIVIPRLLELLRVKDGILITTKPNTTYVQVNRICREIGLPEVGVHGLRHSFASLAYHLKWSESTTMREGGWANTATVHKVYTHLAEQDANVDIVHMQQFFEQLT